MHGIVLAVTQDLWSPCASVTRSTRAVYGLTRTLFAASRTSHASACPRSVSVGRSPVEIAIDRTSSAGTARTARATASSSEIGQNLAPEEGSTGGAVHVGHFADERQCQEQFATHHDWRRINRLESDHFPYGLGW